MSAPSAARAAAPRAYPPAASPAPSRSRTSAPRLRVVRPPQQARTRVPFVLACMAVLAGALLCALLLNTTMASNAYESYRLSNELGQLDQDQKDLVADLDRKASPAELAKAASALGMVPAEGTGWLRLADGTVQGPDGSAG